MVKILTGTQVKIKLKDLCDGFTMGDYGELCITRGGKKVAIFRDINGGGDTIFGHSVKGDDKAAILTKLVKTISMVTFYVSNEVMNKNLGVGSVLFPSDDSKYKIEAKVYDYNMLLPSGVRELRADKLPSQIQELLYSGSISNFYKNAMDRPYYCKASTMKSGNTAWVLEEMRERKILVHSTDDPGRDFAICSFATAYKSDQCPDTGCKLISEDLVFVDINAETPPDIMSKSAMSKMVAAIKEKTNTGKVLFPYFYVHRGAVKKAHFLYAEWGENTFKLNFNKTDTVMV